MHRVAWRVAAVAATGALAIGAAACGSDNKSSSGSSGSSSSGSAAKGKVAVLLPDSKSSVRWETVDRPFLKQSVIDYDRLTLNGDSDYYVSFDNEKVGQLQGQGLVDCLGTTNGQAIAELNGSPTDNNATLFKKGYDSVLNPLYDSGKLKKAADQSVPDWDNQKGLQIFEQMLQKNNNKIDGVLAANDGLGNSAISALKARKLKQIPVTGQDATLQGIQNIVAGDQCMTVYKAIKKEADAAAKLAIALAKGEKPSAPATINNGKTDVPAVFETPVAVTKDNIGDYLGEPDFPKKEEICAGKLASACSDLGL
jgi:D-xylose transport system substrate-binding protein